MAAAAAAVLAAASWAQAPSAGGEPAGGPLTPAVWAALDLAGENARELLKALSEAPAADREAVRFLIESLPPVDLATADAPLLLETARLAREARERFPWGAGVPDPVYLRYVVAPRVSQEPLERWREFLLGELGPRLEGTASMTEAALEVNRWCGEHVTFKPTQRRDQGVFETLASGYGRCEEMVIVHISALRSVCIPAREAWTPYWATSDNNHAWTEVWVDGGWHYAGACEPSASLDDAWFNEAVKNAALVFSSVLGGAAPGEDAYREEERFAIVNSTGNYTSTGMLEVTVRRAGAPADSVPVTVSLWNFGSLRPIARRDSGDDGTARLTIGDGDYFVCAGGPDAYDWRVVRVEAGGTSAVELDLSASPRFDGRLVLRYDRLGE